MKLIKILSFLIITILISSCKKNVGETNIVQDTKNLIVKERVHVSEFEKLKNGKLGPTFYDEEIGQSRLMLKGKYFTGIVFDNYSEDIMDFEHEYVDGLLDGEHKDYFYRIGQIKKLVTYEKGILNGPFEEYYENGQLFKKGTMIRYKYVGPFEEYYENGQLMRKGVPNYHGWDKPFVEYYEDGQIKIKDTSKYDEIEIPSEHDESFPEEEYYENGKLLFKGTRRGGIIYGPFEDYYENGQLRSKGTYLLPDKKMDSWIEYGGLNGIYEEYYENGQLRIKQTYRNGKLNGPCEEYFKNGKLKNKETLIEK